MTFYLFERRNRAGSKKVKTRDVVGGTTITFI